MDYLSRLYDFKKFINVLSVDFFWTKNNQSLPEFLPKPGIKGNA